ncbi:hypothetical protein GCM10010517_04490 [Streptosporangium fragile]|uniref:Uncharacterized protein n=1 Tax=Streptosporangium fragile TaxID=46186 RepID=A0ABN3VPM5_9ACTN
MTGARGDGEGAPGPGTIAVLITRYGRHWLVSEAVGGGYYAVRRNGLSEEILRRRGLSNVLCAAVPGEMARLLAAERERENRPLGK